jgi:ElaB/YqjD/DUF883 family membrane-anchored ribosome-binding protein
MMHSSNSSLESSYRAGQRSLDDAAHALSSGFAAVRERAEPAIDHAAELVAERAHRLRRQASAASERSVGYMRDHPYSSALIAGAAGALIFIALRALMVRRHD